MSNQFIDSTGQKFNRLTAINYIGDGRWKCRCDCDSAGVFQMRHGGGKAKGSAFERDVCVKLSLWISGGKRRDCLWRSAMSGGRATIGKRKGEDLAHQAGDISAVHPDGHVLTDAYFIECKHYRDLEIKAFLVGKGKLARFWKEALKQAHVHKRKPLLIAKQNLFPTIILVETGCSLDFPRLITWRSVSKRGGDVALGWFSTLLKQPPEFTEDLFK